MNTTQSFILNTTAALLNQTDRGKDVLPSRDMAPITVAMCLLLIVSACVTFCWLGYCSSKQHERMEEERRVSARFISRNDFV